MQAAPLAVALALLTAYLTGAIPFGLLISRLRGIDIRRVGSGNIGATNVFRCVGKPWGILVFVLDMLKGLLPALLLPLGIAQFTPTDSVATWRLACGVAAVLGHNWPVYLGFKGGKGVATTTGVLLAVSPLAMLIGFAGWALLFGLTRYVSVASIGTAVIVPLAAWALHLRPWPLVPVVLSILGVLVVWRHRANLQRLRNGTENRFTSTRRKAAP